MSTPTTLSQPSTFFDIPSITSPTFNWRSALSLAHASKLCYSTGSIIENTVRNTWNFKTCHFIDKDNTQCFIASNDDVILVTFRGTESLGDWIKNLNIFSTGRPYGRVHSGFLDAFEVVKKPLEDKIRELVSGAGGGNKVVVTTGHSLGGAVAVVAAAEWRGKFNVRTVYTFAQPAVGKQTFREFMKKYYDDKYFRFVNDQDVGPRLPPLYSHAGKLFHFESDGSLRRGTESLLRVGEDIEITKCETMTEEELEKLKKDLIASDERIESTEFRTLGDLPWIADHAIDEYIRLINANVR